MERAADTIEFVIRSLEKQEMWFLNYKNRKDGMMSLVFNLVTQQDAANGMEIAADTKRDSTSMNAIAALTMVFLPGTFTAVSTPYFFSSYWRVTEFIRLYLGRESFPRIQAVTVFTCPIFGGSGLLLRYL